MVNNLPRRANATTKWTALQSIQDDRVAAIPAPCRIGGTSSSGSLPELPPLLFWSLWWGCLRVGFLDAAAELFNLNANLLNELRRLGDNVHSRDLLKALGCKRKMAVEIVNRPDIRTTEEE